MIRTRYFGVASEYASMLGHLVHNGHGDEMHFGWPVRFGWLKRLMLTITVLVRG